MSDTSFEVRDDIGLLWIDYPPVNALSRGVRSAIIEAVERTAGDPGIHGLVIACKGRTFCAGADIKEFKLPPSEPFLTQVVDVIASSPKPVAAAIHGTALGGGLEIAMACHYRVADAGARLGMPEVKLGLMPGARGTQMLPRLVGIEKALQMACFGSPITADDAAGCGLIDAIATTDLVSETVALLQSRIGQPLVPICDRGIPPAEPEVFDSFLTRNSRKFRGLSAPPAIVRAIQAALEQPYEEAAALERKLFLELREGPQSKALRHVFQAERAARKVPELEGVKPIDIDSVGIVGAGTMGTGISINFLLAGMPVVLVEQQQDALDRGVETIRKAIERNVSSGRTSRQAADEALALLRPGLDYTDLAQADLIIEAAFELLEVKQDIFRQLGTIARDGAILATNTSYLDLDDIAAAGGRGRETIGLHFFSPANIMKLLEIVRGRETSPTALATALDIARRIGKVAVVAGNAYGFIGNRMLAVRRKEAESMIAEGASPYAVDAVLEEFGFPMGPFKIGDLAGLDLGWSEENSTGATIRERLCEAGRRGQKTGAGFYDYDDKRHPSPSPEAEKIIAGFAEDNGTEQHDFDEAEVLARLLWPMVDEGARLLGEGIARSASDIDVVWINGYGWPAWTGGPMFYAGEFGFARVADELRRLGYSPSETLLSMAAQ